MNFIQIFLDNIAQLMPFEVIMSYHHGVRWTFGKNPKPLKPGIHWRIMGIHKISTVGNVPEVIDLPTQSVTTPSGKSLTFSANIGYIVTDPVAHFCNVYNFEQSLRGAAAIHLSQAVRLKNLSDVRPEQLAAMEDELRESLTKTLGGWGTAITHVGFTDFVQTRPALRLYVDPATKVL